jgi:hypothetical protein
MGIFKSIKKLGKKIFTGLKTKFMKGMAFIGKITNSKWGKILMLASSIFTGGMALAGAFQGFANAGTGFLAKFVGTAKGFMGGLTQPLKQAKKLMKIGETAATIGKTTGALTGAAEAAKPMQNVLAGVTQAGQEVGARLPQALQVPGKALTAGMDLAQQTEAGAGGGWLSKAAGFAADFIKSEAGAGLISGVGKGIAAEEQQKHEDRFRRAWADPNNPFAKLTGESGFGAETAPAGPAPVPSFGGQTYQAPQQPQGGQF